MPSVNRPTPTSSKNISWVSQDSSNPEDQDIWFDAIDLVEMEETWFEGAEAFDPHEEHQTAPSSSAGKAADSLVPFTEDCRRGVQLFVRTLGKYGESRMLSACLHKILPGTPVSLVIAANSLYTAVTERRNIDTAALHTLGLASGYLPENMNVVSRLAAFIRDTVTGWTDETFLQQFLGNEENHTSIHLFTALAITTIVAGRWMKDEGGPQRGVLKVPAFMANIFIRASHYWTALGNMAGSLSSGAAIPEKTGTSQYAPAFEVDTQVEMTRDVSDATACGTSAPRLAAFSSNSTAHPEAYTRATVQNRPAPAFGKNTRFSVPEQAHYLAVEKLRQESGLSDLLYCTNLKTETRQQTNEKVITNTHFNTKCDATVYHEPLTKEADSIPVHTEIQETQVSSAATSRSVGDPLLPIVMTAATVATTSPYLQTLKSKTVIAAGAAVSLTGLAVGGKLLWDKLSTSSPVGRVDDLEKSRDTIISNEEYNQAIELINALEVSDLDFIFEDSNDTLTLGIRMKRDNRQNEEITIDFNEENIPFFIDAILKQIRDVKIKETFQEIFTNNQNVSGKINGSESLSVLLLSLHDIIIFLLNNKNTISDNQFSEGRDTVISFWALFGKGDFPAQYMKLVDEIYANIIFITSTVDDIPERLNFFISNIKDTSFKREVESISGKIYASLDKVGSYEEDDTKIHLLIQHISLLTDFAADFHMTHGVRKSYKLSLKLIKNLWKLADSLPELNSQRKIREFAEYRQLLQSGGEVLSMIENLFPPIFDPNSYIDDFIDNGIKGFENSTGKKMNLKPSSIIHATRHVHTHGVFTNSAKTFPVDISLRDIVTNMHIMRLGETPYLTYDPTIKLLIGFLKKTHLQNKMSNELSDYKNDDGNEKAMTAHYRNMIDYRCLYYLSPANKDNKYASYVLGFLNGEVQAREFFFYNIKLNGVFFIPAENDSKGVLFSVDEPMFFNLDSFKHTLYINDHPRTKIYTSTPDNPAFREWVLSKLPIKERAEYDDKTHPFDYLINTSAISGYPSIHNLLIDYLTSSEQTFNIKEIPTKLFNQLMVRLGEDIDALNFSTEEIDAQEREEIFRVLKMFFSVASFIIAPMAAISSTAVYLGYVISAIDVMISVTEAGIASVKGDKNANALMNEAMTSAFMSLISQRFGQPIRTQNLIKFSAANFQKTVKLSKNTIPAIFKNKVKHATFAKDNKLPYRGMGPKIIKPKMSDFTNEHGVFNKLEFDKSMRKYIQEKGVIERMANVDKNAPDERYRRKLIAENKMISLRGSHSYTLDSVIDNRFTLHYVKDSPADTAVLSAHGWFTKDSTQLTLSDNQELLFLGPHGSILLEPPEVGNLLPMESLLAGKENPLIYSKLTNKEFISYKQGSSLSNDEIAINYKLSHYEKVPDEEVQLSLLSNRINKNKEKMDVITVNEKVDSPRYREPTLRDLMNLIKRNKSFQSYKKIVFLACREEKTPGVLRQSVNDVKLGSGYEIEFTEENFAMQSKVKKRSINSYNSENDINFDGYLIYELITVEKDKVSRELQGIAPYIKMKST